MTRGDPADKMSGGGIFVRQPRRSRRRVHELVTLLMLATVLLAMTLYGGLLLELISDSMRSDEKQLASWIQALIALGALGVTTLFMWLQGHSQIGARADELDDEFYRNVASFTLIAERLLDRIRDGQSWVYSNDNRVGPNFLLMRLQEAPFYAFPSGRALTLAMSIADQLTQILQHRSQESIILAQYDDGRSIRLHQAVRAIESELRALQLTAADWVPTYKGRFIRKALGRMVRKSQREFS
ncbi:MAG: hypothetical protein IE913_01950 [Halothiobacillus sp.]|nr:hypothetical protein [Halothiobacillus sp.]